VRTLEQTAMFAVGGNVHSGDFAWQGAEGCSRRTDSNSARFAKVRQLQVRTKTDDHQKIYARCGNGRVC